MKHAINVFGKKNAHHLSDCKTPLPTPTRPILARVARAIPTVFTQAMSTLPTIMIPALSIDGILVLLVFAILEVL